MKYPIVTVIGGSGFLGRYVVQHLARSNYRIRVVCRNPNGALHLKTSGDPGQIQLISGNITRPETLKEAVQHAYAVIDLVGILFPSHGQSFDDVQAEGAGKLAAMAASAGVRRFVYLSALGVDKAFGSDYARTKLTGEKNTLTAFPSATILRPSVMFGAEDQFLNDFASMPFHPLIGGGKTRFQPIYVDDVAKAVIAAITRHDTQGEIYELGGSQIYSMKRLLHYVQSLVGKKPTISLSFPFTSGIAAIAELVYHILPFANKPLLTRDQVRLLKHDNIVSNDTKTIANLGIHPQPLESVVPVYLARYNPKRLN